MDSSPKRTQQPIPNSSGKKGRKKINKNQNPFEDLPMGDSQPNKDQWIIPKKSPLTIEIANYSKINKFYSHKSLQKYIRYLYANTCPNPLWLSIKRQSQIQHIFFIDIEVQNSLFYKYLNGSIDEEEKNYLEFLRQFNAAERKAIFKEAPFIEQSKDLWESLFCYDQESIKTKEMSKHQAEMLSSSLSQELYQKYYAYTLTQQQMKNNLYPMVELPAYKDYLVMINQGKQSEQINNMILMVDCEMVLSAEGFQLARVTIMNFGGETIYDKFFKPKVEITNYNTIFSGITKQTLENVHNTIEDLHEDMKHLITPKTILVGHSLENDLHAMHMIYDKVIDTSVLFARKNGSKMKLKTIAYQLLHRTIQVGKHCSEEDCQATLDILRYRIEIQENKQFDKKMHLLKQLIEAKKQILIVDDEIDFLKHQQYLNAIHFEKCDSEALPSEKLKIFHKYLSLEVRNPDVVFSKLRKNKGIQWEQYYENMDDGLRNLYNECPKNSVWMLNFQVNNRYRIYPQEEGDERKRAFCLICVKAQ